MKALMLKNVYEGINARPKVYLLKEYFCEMYPTCVSSKLCEFILPCFAICRLCMQGCRWFLDIIAHMLLPTFPSPPDEKKTTLLLILTYEEKDFEKGTPYLDDLIICRMNND